MCVARVEAAFASRGVFTRAELVHGFSLEHNDMLAFTSPSNFISKRQKLSLLQSTLSEPASTTDAQRSLSSNLQSVLKKASKTLSVILDVTADKLTAGELDTLSMQLRKVKASALATSNFETARALVKEQATAQGKHTNCDPYCRSQLQLNMKRYHSCLLFY